MRKPPPLVDADAPLASNRPWDAAAPYKGLGFRDVEARDVNEVKRREYEITELPVVRA